MDFARDFPQIGQENSRVHSSPDLDELFHSYFDWQAYLNDTEPSPRASPQSLNKLITEISPLIDSIETHRFFRMKTSFGPDEEAVTASDYSADDTRRSVAAGHRVTIPPPHSIADGQLVTTPGELTFPINQRLAESIVTVSEDEIREAMAFAFDRLKLVLEPSGATALAALLTGKVTPLPRRAGVILSGGNVGTRRFAELLG